METMGLIERLKVLQEQEGLDESAFSKKLNILKFQLQNYYRGAPMTNNILEKIASSLQVFPVILYDDFVNTFEPYKENESSNNYLRRVFKWKRISSFMSKESLAKILPIKSSGVENLESGRYEFKSSRINEFSQALSMTPFYFVSQSDLEKKLFQHHVKETENYLKKYLPLPRDDLNREEVFTVLDEVKNIARLYDVLTYKISSTK